MTILVMWSGGIDSTYRLAQLLKDTTENIHAHHIELINYEGRHEAENKACGDLLPILQKIRPFKYTSSTIDYSQFAGIPYDMAIVCFMAGVCARDAAYRDEKVTQWMIGTHKAEGHWQTRFKVIEPVVAAMCWPKDAPEFALGELVSKEEEMRYLDALGLRDYWYCRTPNEGNPCGKCHTCREVNSVSTH